MNAEKADCIRGAAWSDSELYALEYDSKRLIINSLGTTSEGLRDVTWLGWDMYCAVYSNRYEVSRLRLVDPNNDRVPDKRGPGILHSHVISTAAVRGTQAFCALSPTAVLSTGISRQGRRRIELHTPIPSGESRKEWTRTMLWKSHDKGPNVPGDKHITCMLPLELTHIVLGYSDGTIGRSSFAKLVHLNSKLAPEDISDIPLDGFIVGLHIAQNDRTGERLIVGGADDGSVAIWSLESMKTLARWVLFISPLQRVLHLRYDKGGPLRGCLLCIAGDGTIAVIALDDYQFLYMVPGAPAPLIKVCAGGDNLLLLYGDDRARLWDVKTLEFWRSMNMEKAKELLNQGGWAELSLLDTPSAGSAHSTLSAFSPDSSSTILVDLESFLSRAPGVLRSLLQILHTPGLNPDIDVICREQLVLPATLASENPQNLADCVNTVITFYATSLPHSVGRAYIPPSLSFLARWWFDVSGELRLAARTLFDAGETISLVERWQHSLPFLLPDSERRTPVAAKALLLCGFIATRQYNLLSSSALNIISKSVMTYLHESDVSCKALAIDLCSRGFAVWQHYIDAMEMIRSLFNLATSSKKESITAQNIGPQARQAVLHVVTNNTGIFMTTLSLDILHPQSLEHRKSVLQLVAFLTRKKPLVIYPHLPKLVEAVVKSLDPNSTSNRDAVLDTATEILGHVVKTAWPWGTSEGAIVMYDLKTATRLYVLESHKQALVVCSFSPDGRRLATVSLQEGVVLVWKVGTGFASFFYPGAPPRQGHGGSEPFKSLNFNVGEAAVMSLEETFEHVHFEWTAERSVQLKIRDVTLTFST
ncbi:quinon protein alcohol dehydrogenase-like superfamily [Lactarius sanguifluus]|nr:quinon protein alcohol dehydrogenase-like superfamily [Lactarius sanguifluus]